MQAPQISHPTGQANFTRVDLDGVTVYYSYKTPIAFHAEGETVIRQNDWNVTTGRHLNWVNDDHSIRVTGTEFVQRLAGL